MAKINVTIKLQTDKAYLAHYLGVDKWVPKSQVERFDTDGVNNGEGMEAEIVIPDWLYEKNWEPDKKGTTADPY